MAKHSRSIALVVPLGCVAWMLAILVALPGAQAVPPQVTAASHQNVPAFASSSECLACHNQLDGPHGEDVSIGTSWRSTMMANSARDPYWQAGVRRETIDHPTRSDEIQAECATCHMPMTQKPATAAGQKGGVFAYLPGGTASEADRRMASDGIGCTVCHQIAKDRLGTPESFNANFVVASPVNGVRQIQGPYKIDAGRQRIMRSVTGYEPVEAPHIKDSALCASCHTLITQAFGSNGQVVGRLPEQMNFQEWQHSAFVAEQKSCQSCHMPRVAGPVRIASVLGEYRDGLSRHLFVGGNAFMIRLFDKFSAELGVQASHEELEATAQATERQLREDTARIAVEGVTQPGTTLSFNVDVQTLAGHTFPTGYPSRRTWLHVTVRDAGGRAVFESGAVDATGSIAGNDSDADGARFEPHYDVISAADQVQIYEAILGDPAGKPTTGLLTATRYLKDNRLLPRGFDKVSAHADIGVYGEAAQDSTFVGGSDRVRYRVPVSGAGPFTVEAELRYQPIGYRWAHNLDSYQAPEPQRFVKYFNALSSSSSLVVATATGR